MSILSPYFVHWPTVVPVMIVDGLGLSTRLVLDEKKDRSQLQKDGDASHEVNSNEDI